MKIDILKLLNESEECRVEVQKFCQEYGIDFQDLYLLYRESVMGVPPGYIPYGVMREFLSDLKATLFGEEELSIEAVFFEPKRPATLPKIGFLFNGKTFVKWSHPMFGKVIIEQLLKNPNYPYWIESIKAIKDSNASPADFFSKIQKKAARDTLLSWGLEYIQE